VASRLRYGDLTTTLRSLPYREDSTCDSMAVVATFVRKRCHT
jgi:hypothetical protein